MTPEQIERIKQLVADLSDEADLCRSETCDDFANLLWRAMDAIEFLLIRAQAARAGQIGWIRVEDKLPEESGRFLVIYESTSKETPYTRSLAALFGESRKNETRTRQNRRTTCSFNADKFNLFLYQLALAHRQRKKQEG